MKPLAGFGYFISLSILFSATFTATTVKALPMVSCHFLEAGCGLFNRESGGDAGDSANIPDDPRPDPDEAAKNATPPDSGDTPANVESPATWKYRASWWDYRNR